MPTLHELEHTEDAGYSTNGGEYSGYASEVGTHRRRGWLGVFVCVCVCARAREHDVMIEVVCAICVHSRHAYRM